MSDSRAIAAISAALAHLLQPAGGDTLQLTLYRVTPNARLRNARPRPGEVTQPTMAVDLHYLIAFAGDAGLPLGKVLTILAANAVLTAETIDAHVADPGLHGAVAPGEILQIGLETPTLDEASNLWQALAQPLRPALFYTVGPVLLA